jgi:hypothetical protein
MAILERVKKHWVTVALYLALSLFFLSACFVSANTYGAIAQAQRDIALQNPEHRAEIVQHGNLNISFSIQLHNPSRFTLHINWLSWSAALMNTSSSDNRRISLGENYFGPTRYLEVPARATVNYTFWSKISDPGVLAKLSGYVNYANGLGGNYTLETLPYDQTFLVMLFIGEFEHESLRDAYLNELVTVSLSYSSAEGVA